MIEVLVVIFGMIGFFFALVIFHARRSMAYIYCSATISAWEARLFPEARLRELADAPGVVNIFAALDDTDYRQQLAGIQREGEVDMIEVENAFRDNSNSRYLEILKMVPKERKETIRRVLQRAEVWDLKAIVTAIHNKTPKEERLKELMPSPTMPRERLEMLASAENFEQLLEFLKESEYFSVLSEALGEYEERGLIPLLSAFDRYYYTSLWREVLRVKAQRSILKSLVGCEIDIVNLKLILRLKREGVNPEEIDRYLIRPSHMLTEGMLRAMAVAEDIRSAVDVVSRTPYGKILLEVLPQIEAQGLSAADRVLDEMQLKVFRWLALTKLFSIAPVLSYIRLKENEMKNLRAIIRLKVDKVEPQKIKETIVKVQKIEF
ncbi:MAG: hypothetical protein AVW05_01095 [Hadesarchaea archaeon DG-33]|nr:MAG: hypothetical protein AVW05_01095 [Hadesarchaea archaeon DG-33]